MHTGEKVLCEICGLLYSSLRGLRDHKKKKHPILRTIEVQTLVVGGDALFRCLVCDTAYGGYRLPYLLQHIETCQDING